MIIIYQNDALKVLTGECRLSYVHLDKPYSNNPGQEAKYSVTLLIPKTDTTTKADIDASIQAAIAEGINKTWGGQRPAMPKVPIHDGDGLKQNGEPFGPECKGCWVMTAGSQQKPQVVHQSNIRAELSPTDMYSGMYGRVTLRFFSYSNSGNKGIGCGLGNVLKTRDGEPLAANRSDAADDFAQFEGAAPAQAATPAGYPVVTYPAAPSAPAYPASYPPAGYPGTYPGAQHNGGYQQGYPAPGGINPITGQPM